MATGVSLGKEELERLAAQPNTHVLELEERPRRAVEMPAADLAARLRLLHNNFCEGLRRFPDASDDQIRYMLRNMVMPEIAEDLYKHNKMCFYKLTDRHTDAEEAIPFFEFMFATLADLQAGLIGKQVADARVKKKGEELGLFGANSKRKGTKRDGSGSSGGKEVRATINFDQNRN